MYTFPCPSAYSVRKMVRCDQQKKRASTEAKCRWTNLFVASIYPFLVLRTRNVLRSCVSWSVRYSQGVKSGKDGRPEQRAGAAWVSVPGNARLKAVSVISYGHSWQTHVMQRRRRPLLRCYDGMASGTSIQGEPAVTPWHPSRNAGLAAGGSVHEKEQADALMMVVRPPQWMRKGREDSPTAGRPPPQAWRIAALI